MTNEILENHWSGIRYHGNSEYEFVVIADVNKPVLCIGFNSKIQRCLLLEVPPGTNGNWPGVEKDNLSLKWIPSKGYLVIELTNDSYSDQFNYLILSIYNVIAKFSLSSDYISGFIRLFNKWSGFFDDFQPNRLQDEALRGLIGELVVLRELLSEASYEAVNQVLSSWRGPYNQVRDFISDVKDLEVKTTIANSDIRISSEFQLEPDLGKELQLAVVTIQSDLVNGFSLKSLIFLIRDKIDELLGDHSILADGLFQKGLTFHNVGEYDNLRFNAIKIDYYNCLQPGFPSLRRAELPPSVYQVSYRLRLSTISNFIIQTSVL